MTTYPRNTAVQIIGTVLLDHEMVHPGFRGTPGEIGGCEDGSPATRARSQAADLLDEYGMNMNRDVESDVPTQLVADVISDILDEVEERTGKRPDMPVAIATFRC